MAPEEPEGVPKEVLLLSTEWDKVLLLSTDWDKALRTWLDTPGGAQNAFDPSSPEHVAWINQYDLISLLTPERIVAIRTQHHYLMLLRRQAPSDFLICGPNDHLFMVEHAQQTRPFIGMPRGMTNMPQHAPRVTREGHLEVYRCIFIPLREGRHSYAMCIYPGEREIVVHDSVGVYRRAAKNVASFFLKHFFGVQESYHTGIEEDEGNDQAGWTYRVASRKEQGREVPGTNDSGALTLMLCRYLMQQQPFPALNPKEHPAEMGRRCRCWIATEMVSGLLDPTDDDIPFALLALPEDDGEGYEDPSSASEDGDERESSINSEQSDFPRPNTPLVRPVNGAALDTHLSDERIDGPYTDPVTGNMILTWDYTLYTAVKCSPANKHIPEMFSRAKRHSKQKQLKQLKQE